MAAGDSFTFAKMLETRHIDWVQTLLVPWIIFFALAAVASAFSILSKLHFFVGKMRSNFARRSHLSASAVTVNDALHQNDFNTRKIYAYANNAHAGASVRSTRTHALTGTWSSGSARRVSRRALVWPQPPCPLLSCRCSQVSTIAAGGEQAAWRRPSSQPFAIRPQPRSLRPSANHPCRALPLQVVRRLPSRGGGPGQVWSL